MVNNPDYYFSDEYLVQRALSLPADSYEKVEKLNKLSQNVRPCDYVRFAMTKAPIIATFEINKPDINTNIEVIEVSRYNDIPWPGKIKYLEQLLSTPSCFHVQLSERGFVHRPKYDVFSDYTTIKKGPEHEHYYSVDVQYIERPRLLDRNEYPYRESIDSLYRVDENFDLKFHHLYIRADLKNNKNITIPLSATTFMPAEHHILSNHFFKDECVANAYAQALIELHNSTRERVYGRR